MKGFALRASPQAAKKRSGPLMAGASPSGLPRRPQKKKRAAYGDPLSCRRIQDMQLMAAVPDGYYVFTGTAVFLWQLFLL